LEALKKIICLPGIKVNLKNSYNKSPIEIAFLKRKSKDPCYLFLKKQVEKIYIGEMVQTGILLFSTLDLDQPITETLENLGLASPFTRNFYADMDYIKILKKDRFEA